MGLVKKANIILPCQEPHNELLPLQYPGHKVRT